MVDRDSYDSLKRSKERIEKLEREGYRFKGSYNVEGWLFLVYEKE